MLLINYFFNIFINSSEIVAFVWLLQFQSLASALCKSSGVSEEDLPTGKGCAYGKFIKSIKLNRTSSKTENAFVQDVC